MSILFIFSQKQLNFVVFFSYCFSILCSISFFLLTSGFAFGVFFPFPFLVFWGIKFVIYLRSFFFLTLAFIATNFPLSTSFAESYKFQWGFPGGSVIKNLSANEGDVGLIIKLGRSPGKGNGNPLQYYHLGNLMDRGLWWAILHGVTGVGHDLATKQQHINFDMLCFDFHLFQSIF